MRYLLKNSDYEDIFKHIEEDSDMSQEVISEDIAFSFAKALIDNTLINSRSKVSICRKFVQGTDRCGYIKDS